MDIFILLSYYCCDDQYYGYQERFHSAYDTLEKAKEKVIYLIDDDKHKKYYIYDGINGNPFLTVVKVSFGSLDREVVFDSMEYVSRGEEPTQTQS